MACIENISNEDCLYFKINKPLFPKRKPEEFRIKINSIKSYNPKKDFLYRKYKW